MSKRTASPSAASAASTRPDSTRSGPGRLLVAVYALFALSATARAVVQIATKFGHAPVAYLLSAFAAAVYILATVTLAVGTPVARRIAAVSCTVEFIGVLAIGTWSLADKATFPDATVWSGYGSGYGYVPLVLPVFGLLWLRYWSKRTKAERPAGSQASSAAAGSAEVGEAAGSAGASSVGGAGVAGGPETAAGAGGTGESAGAGGAGRAGGTTGAGDVIGGVGSRADEDRV